MLPLEIEIKGYINDFDKVGRKQLTRLKNAKTEHLVMRANVLATYGLRSRERSSKYRSKMLYLALW